MSLIHTRPQFTISEFTMYQPTSGTVAAVPQNPERNEGNEGRDTHESFAEGLRSVARRLYFSTPHMTTSDRQFLQDVMRDEHRYPMRALERLAIVARKSSEPKHREALAELVREHSTPPLASVPSVAAAFDEETRSQGIADLEQRRFERERTRINQERVIEALRAQEIATRESINAVREVAVR